MRLKKADYESELGPEETIINRDSHTLGLCDQTDLPA